MLIWGFQARQYIKIDWCANSSSTKHRGFTKKKSQCRTESLIVAGIVLNSRVRAAPVSKQPPKELWTIPSTLGRLAENRGSRSLGTSCIPTKSFSERLDFGILMVQLCVPHLLQYKNCHDDCSTSYCSTILPILDLLKRHLCFIGPARPYALC